MCTCASCENTDKLAGLPDLFGELRPGRDVGGFARWPRGNVTGKRASTAEYNAHTAHLWDGIAKRVPFTPGQPPRFNIPGLVLPVTPAPKSVLDWINRSGPQFERVKKASPAKAEPARPTQPGKAKPHFPELDRQPETAVIYAMPKSKSKPEDKRPVGRPAIQGRRVVIKLEDEQIKRAEKLGGGNVAAGIRKALSK